MSRAHLMLLYSGGLRSLVAAALALRGQPRPRLTLLHVIDGRENAGPRREHLRLASQWLNIKAITELRLPHLYPKDAPRDEHGRPTGPLVLPQLLLAGLNAAHAAQAHRLIYPGSFDAQPAAVATTTEQVQLVEHLAMSVGSPMPRIDTPLLELSDAQIITLGEQLEVPWHATWSCQLRVEMPCRACHACRRRRKAFEEARVSDTQVAAMGLSDASRRRYAKTSAR